MTKQHRKSLGSSLEEALKPKVLAIYQRLPANQRKVADYVLQRPQDLAFLTTDSLAQKLRVSKATVVRFAQSLGYEGFADLQRRVVGAVQSNLDPVGRFVIAPKEQQPEGTLTLVAEHEVENINQTMLHLDRRTFGDVVNMLIRASRVYTMGVGISSLLAEVLAYELNQVTVDARPLSGGWMRFVEHLVFAKKNDVVVGFSFPPYSRETVEAAAYAKSRGIAVVAITDRLTSPITFQAKKVLAVRTTNMLYTNSVSAISVVINALVTEIALKNKRVAEKMFKESSRVLRQTDEFVGDGSA